MKRLAVCCALLVMVCSGNSNTPQEPERAEEKTLPPSDGLPRPVAITSDPRVIEAFVRLGAVHKPKTDPKTKQTIDIFRMPRTTTDHDLRMLPKVPFAFGLNLFDTQVTDAELKEIASLKNLTDLDLGGPKVTDAGLKAIASLKNLTSLSLNFTKITDAGLKEIASLKNLTSLALHPGDGCGVEGDRQAQAPDQP